ncbi:MAG TPA: hypothetical protein PLW86_13840 [Rhodocyclaceae bacterium]|nr:hypothetical protein [Rhodocyclaceae bacterium]
MFYAAEVLASGAFIADLSFSPAHLLVDRVTVKGKALATELHAVFDEYPADLASGCDRYRGNQRRRPRPLRRHE